MHSGSFLFYSQLKRKKVKPGQLEKVQLQIYEWADDDNSSLCTVRESSCCLSAISDLPTIHTSWAFISVGRELMMCTCVKSEISHCGLAYSFESQRYHRVAMNREFNRELEAFSATFVKSTIMTRCSAFLYTNAHSFSRTGRTWSWFEGSQKKSMMLEQNLISNLFRTFGLSLIGLKFPAEVRKVEICQQKNKRCFFVF